MFQNTNSKKLRVIRRHIDMELSKIYKLLSRINRKKNNTNRNVIGGKIGTQQQEMSCDWAENQPYDKISQTALIHKQKEAYQYQFREVEIYKQQEQILVDHSKNHQYASTITVSRALTISVLVKSNWIQKYLDHGDCKISILKDEQAIEVIGVQNGIASCITPRNQFIKLDMAQISKYDSLQVTFMNHTKAVSLSTHLDGRSQLYQLNIKSTTRFVINVANHERHMRRVLIIEQNEEQEDVRYELAWGTYFNQQLSELVTLKPGKYTIITLGITPLDIIELYFSSNAVLDIKVAAEQPLKTRYILTKTFTQKCDDCYEPVSNDIHPQYIRNVYMDIGIVVQTYVNIYHFQTIFLDEQPHKEDISLLFSELYSAQQIQNRLEPGEKIVKFYSIQRKPALMFVPRKYVLMGSKIMQTIKVHSVFK